MEGFKNLNTADFRNGIATNPKAVVLDVRTPMEYDEGHLADAQLLNIASPGFVNKINELDKNKPYYLYCRSGARSASACQYMVRQGFTELYNLAGGVISWRGELV